MLTNRFLPWEIYYDEFEYRYDDLFSREYGFFRPVVSHIVRKYLECGDLERGEEQKRGPPAHPKKCSEVIVEPFDDGWPEYEETFIEVQA